MSTWVHLRRTNDSAQFLARVEPQSSQSPDLSLLCTGNLVSGTKIPHPAAEAKLPAGLLIALHGLGSVDEASSAALGRDKRAQAMPIAITPNRDRQFHWHRCVKSLYTRLFRDISLKSP